MALAQQPLRAPPRQHLFEMLEQITVFAAQIKKAGVRADRQRRQRHALENMIGEARQQHAVLKSAGLALVGVANDDAALGRGRGAAELPFARRGEAGAAATARIGRVHLRQQRLGANRDRAAQRLARLQPTVQQHVAPANIVVDDEKFARPLL